MLIDDIKEAHIQNLINEAIENKKKPTTIKRNAMSISGTPTDLKLVELVVCFLII